MRALPPSFKWRWTTTRSFPATVAALPAMTTWSGYTHMATAQQQIRRGVHLSTFGIRGVSASRCESPVRRTRVRGGAEQPGPLVRRQGATGVAATWPRAARAGGRRRRPSEQSRPVPREAGLRHETVLFNETGLSTWGSAVALDQYADLGQQGEVAFRAPVPDGGAQFLVDHLEVGRWSRTRRATAGGIGDAALCLSPE